MRERDQRRASTLADIARFLGETEFTNPRLRQLKREVLAHNERVTKLATENRGAKTKPEALRLGRHLTKDRLRRDQMLPLSRRGRKLARLVPELQHALKVPHKNAPITEIVDAADRIADALTPHLSVLIKAKFPRNCLDILRRDAQALRAHADAVTASRQLIGRSNRELTQELSLARDTINELDAVLRSLDGLEHFKRSWTYWNRVGARKGLPSKRRLAARERSAANAKVGTGDDRLPTAARQ
jgi:hypothetical protein